MLIFPISWSIWLKGFHILEIMIFLFTGSIENSHCVSVSSNPLHLHAKISLIFFINLMKFLRNPHINLQRFPLAWCCRTEVPDTCLSSFFLLEIYLRLFDSAFFICLVYYQNNFCCVWHLRNTKMEGFPE